MAPVLCKARGGSPTNRHVRARGGDAGARLGVGRRDEAFRNDGAGKGPEVAGAAAVRIAQGRVG